MTSIWSFYSIGQIPQTLSPKVAHNGQGLAQWPQSVLMSLG